MGFGGHWGWAGEGGAFSPKRARVACRCCPGKLLVLLVLLVLVLQVPLVLQVQLVQLLVVLLLVQLVLVLQVPLLTHRPRKSASAG